MTDDIVNNPINLDTTNTMLHQHADMRYPAIVSFFVVRQPSFGWFLLRLKYDHTRQAEPLKPSILPQHAALWQLVLGFIGNPFIMGFAFVCRAQKPDAPVRIDQQHILDRMLFLLATVVDCLLIGIFRSRYRSFRAIVAKKGGASGSSSL